ncbi:MAG: M15 family metallopeptidase [Dehalococcoidia bacterium]|nr:M15 family metallopeptidase [Dehalococcoidia bacterium]
MRLTRRAFLNGTGAVLVAAIAAPLIQACGGDEEPQVQVNTPTATPTEAPPEPTPTSTVTPEPEVGFNPDLHLLVDKDRALPDGFVPPDLEPIPASWHIPEFGGLQLRAPVIEALAPMRAAAASDGVDLLIRSAYRSYDEQVVTFQYWVDTLGEEQARRESAVPGHSEHQLGTTMDFAAPDNGWALVESFADTAPGLWLADHAHEYGFALSYPRDGEAITGYIYEPWHYRYIGVEASMPWRESGLTLIEFLEGLQEQA